MKNKLQERAQKSKLQDLTSPQEEEKVVVINRRSVSVIKSFRLDPQS